jgi:signal transduction histidine kinase
VRREATSAPSDEASDDPAGAPDERLRGLRERLRVVLDPPETGRDPSVLTRLVESSRAFARTHIQLTDGALAFVLSAVCLRNAELAHRSLSAAVFTLLLALPLAWRRRAPITVFLVIAAVAFAQWLADLQLLADLALLAALYTVAADRPQRAAVGGAFILEGGTVLAAVRWPQGESVPATVALLSGLVVAALVSGLYVRARRLHVAGLVERAARLEFERDQQALLAAAAERARISREMHDVVAHSLAVVISLANGATAKLKRDPEQSREALESISALGRQALTDTRQLLTVLRPERDAAMRAPQPGIEQIAGLIDRAAATGLAATLTVHGDPVPVAPGLALSAYRIVQEAITNAVKHAEGATTVAVELTWTSRRLEIAVTDNGHGEKRSIVPAHGLGLVGMRERAVLYGGTATAGPERHGGWTVTATIPLGTGGAL